MLAMPTIELLAASDLVHQSIYLPSTGEIPLSRDPAAPTVVDLVAGAHQPYTGSANPCTFTFTVTPAATVVIAPEFGTFLKAEGSRLTFLGLPVTIDARYLSGGIYMFVLGGNFFGDFIVYQRCRLLPNQYGYAVEQGAAIPAVSGGVLGNDGHWSYDPKYDIHNNGFLAGRGTSTIQFLGYPCIIDARRSGGSVLDVSPLVADRPTSMVQLLNLLPPQAPGGFELIVSSAVRQPEATFTLTADGTFVAVGSAVTIDRFH